MSDILIEEMLDAGCHFGHQTRRWNPKMKPYIYGVRSGIHIIDLQQTQGLAQKALNALEKIVAQGRDVLFVGTKAQAQGIVEQEAIRAKMPFVTKRWLGGMLTNFSTIRHSVERLIELETRREKNDFTGYTKKERLGFDREIAKLQEVLSGIKKMNGLPGAIFVVDPHVEKIPVHEANILGISVIAITDTNCNPDPIDHVIPANDDAQRSIQVFITKAADACLSGLEKREAMALKAGNDTDSKKPEGKRRRSTVVEGTGKAYVAKDPCDSYANG